MVLAQQSVVKNALKEEDRSKNLVVFGLVEEEKEQLENIVGELLSDLGEKPRVSATRIGVKSNESRSKPVCRPVKLSLSNSSTAHQILLKAPYCQDSQGHTQVQVCLHLPRPLTRRESSTSCSSHWTKGSERETARNDSLHTKWESSQCSKRMNLDNVRTIAIFGQCL